MRGFDPHHCCPTCGGRGAVLTGLSKPAWKPCPRCCPIVPDKHFAPLGHSHTLCGLEVSDDLSCWDLVSGPVDDGDEEGWCPGCLAKFKCPHPRERLMKTADQVLPETRNQLKRMPISHVKRVARRAVQYEMDLTWIDKCRNGAQKAVYGGGVVAKPGERWSMRGPDVTVMLSCRYALTEAGELWVSGEDHAARLAYNYLRQDER